MNIQEIRQKYPQYDNISDEQLAKGLHQKYYSAMPFDEFSKRIGLVSTEDTVTGAVSAFAHGGSLGLADKVGGIMNALGAAPVDAIMGGKSFLQAFKDRYDEIADTSKKNREDFETNHPLAGFALETGGNIGGAGRAIYKQLADKGLKGAKLLAAAGGTEGVIQGAADADKILDVPVSAVAQGAVGAALAPLIPAGIKVARWVNAVRNPAKRAEKRAAEAILKEVPERDLRNMAYDAQRFNSNVLATGDDKILKLAQQARQQTPEAASRIETVLRDLADSRPTETRRRIALHFGNDNGKITGKYENIDDLVERAKTQAAPLYDALRKIGDLDAYALGKKGSKELGGRLKTQKFSNIEFGRMRPEKLAQLNEIRAANGEAPLAPDMKIPLNVVKKLYDKRVISDKMKPEQVADMVFDVFYSPETVVDASKYPHVQALIKPRDKVSQVGFISQNPKNGETVIKSAYRESTDKLKSIYEVLNRVLEGRTEPVLTEIPSSLGSKTESLRQAARFSDVQNPNVSNISPLGEYVKDNDFIQEIIKKIRKDTSLDRDVRHASDTDFQILDEAQRAIGDMIETAKRTGENNAMMRYTKQKAELLKQMDKIAPQYKEARKLYEAKANSIRAQAIGEDIFKPEVSPELMARNIKDMDWLEKKSMKIGSTAELLRKLGQAQNEATALGRMLNDNTLQKIEMVYGKPKAKVFANYIKSEVRRNRNTNRVLSGSQTSEKQSLRDQANLSLSILRNPTGIIGEILSSGENRVRNATNQAMAELLLSSGGEAVTKALNNRRNILLNKYLADILNQGSISAAVNIGE